MSTLSDVEDLYGSLSSTWRKSQAHVIAHILLFIVVFVICRVTLPEITFPKLDPEVISANGWFKLAKDTGLIYVSFIIPIIMIAIYIGVLRTLGQLIVTMLIFMFPSVSSLKFNLFDSRILEPLALSLNKKNFELNDLIGEWSKLVLKYRYFRKDEYFKYYEEFLGNLGKITANFQIYLGDFLVFLLVWIALFQIDPKLEWIHENHAKFWYVTIMLLGVILLAWFRVSRGVALAPTLQIMAFSTLIQADPDIAPLLDVSEETRSYVRERLEYLLQKEQENIAYRPSLRHFICYKLGFLDEISRSLASALKANSPPFRSIYARGEKFSKDRERNQKYDRKWLRDYLAYLYYRFCGWVSHIGFVLRMWINSIILGSR